MTSNYYDSEALRRILQDLTSDDPEFVRSFEADASPPPPPAPDEQPLSSLLWISVFISASVLALLSMTLGSFGSGMFFAAVAWFSASRWLRGDDERTEESEWP